MQAWVNFFIQSIQKLVTTLFSLDLGVGFSFGDLIIACLVIGLVGSALIVKPFISDSASLSRSAEQRIIRRNRLNKIRRN